MYTPTVSLPDGHNVQCDFPGARFTGLSIASLEALAGGHKRSWPRGTRERASGCADGRTRDSGSGASHTPAISVCLVGRFVLVYVHLDSTGYA
jgi:hypothetical protein